MGSFVGPPSLQINTVLPGGKSVCPFGNSRRKNRSICACAYRKPYSASQPARQSFDARG